MNAIELSQIYEAYLDCLNAQAWDQLGDFVAEDATHNGRSFGLDGYRTMLIQDYRDIPDLRFVAEKIVCQPPTLAARLRFDCSPRGRFLGLIVDGRKVSFFEHVIYKFEHDKIREVWSILDKQAIEKSLEV